MKFRYLIFSILLTTYSHAQQGSMVVGGVEYPVDTLVNTHDAGPGIQHTYLNFPTMPLRVNVLEIDITNPYINLEACLGNDSTTATEKPTSMMKRKSHEGHQAIAAINGDFYDTTNGMPVGATYVQNEFALSFSGSRFKGIGMSTDGKAYLGSLTWAATAEIDGNKKGIANINRMRGENQLVLFTPRKGKHTKTNEYGTEVLLELPEGTPFLTTKTTASCVVKKVEKNRGGMLIPEGHIVLSANGTAVPFIDNLKENDLVKIDISSSATELNGGIQQFTDVVCGDRFILRNGEKFDPDWAEKHPRTGVGISKDSTKVYFYVVEGRLPGYAIGISTSHMGDIMLATGSWHAINLDGGGSSAMVVQNTLQNKPSDGNERLVSNALMVISSAPTDNQITKIDITPGSRKMEFGDKLKFSVNSFNQYGSVVDYRKTDGITFSTTGSIGYVDDKGVFVASGSGASGYLIAQYQGLKDSVYIQVGKIKSLSFVVDTIVVDNLQPYTHIVKGYGENNTEGSILPNTLLTWKSLDPAIVQVNEKGEVLGVANGTAKVSILGPDNTMDTTYVKVEIGKGKVILDDFSDLSSWTFSKNLLRDAVVSPIEGGGVKVDYTLNYQAKTASFTFDKLIPIFGIPDSIGVEATLNGKGTSLFFTLTESGAGITSADISESIPTIYPLVYPQVAAPTSFPTTFSSLRISLLKDPSYVKNEIYRGTYIIKNIFVTYPNKIVNSIDKETAALDTQVYPNPLTKGETMFIQLPEARTSEIALYDLQGKQIYKQIEIDPSNYVSVATQHLPQGIFFCKIISEQGTSCHKVIIK